MTWFIIEVHGSNVDVSDGNVGAIDKREQGQRRLGVRKEMRLVIEDHTRQGRRGNLRDSSRRHFDCDCDDGGLKMLATVA